MYERKQAYKCMTKTRIQMYDKKTIQMYERKQAYKCMQKHAFKCMIKTCIQMYEKNTLTKKHTNV